MQMKLSTLKPKSDWINLTEEQKQKIQSFLEEDITPFGVTEFGMYMSMIQELFFISEEQIEELANYYWGC